MSERRKSLKIYSSEYHVFGKLVEVKESDGYLTLVNEDGHERHMAKRFYASWKQKKERAEELIDRNILTRFGGGGMYSKFDGSTYFNEILVDTGNGHGGILDAPADAGPEAAKEIAQLRIYSQLQDYHRSKRAGSLELGLEASKEQLEKLQEHVARLEEERAQLTPDQRGEIARAEADIIKAWPDWNAQPKQAFAIAKANGNLGHVHKVFMLRYGLDVTNKSRLNVTLHSRGRDNYVNVTLDDYEEQRCTLALKRTKGGQWIIASCDAADPAAYYKFEKRVMPANGKDANQPLEWFKQKHEEIFKRIEQATLDV